MRVFEIDETTVNKLGAYLAEKPYKEVWSYIKILSTLKEVITSEKTNEKTSK